MVYGDTDSLFVTLPGASKETAFRVGKDIAERVSKREPAPMQLKFEKVRRSGLSWSITDQVSEHLRKKNSSHPFMQTNRHAA